METQPGQANDNYNPILCVSLNFPNDLSWTWPQLDRLGVTRWSARIHPQVLLPRETMGTSEAGHKSKKAKKCWLRILWRVLALVRNIVDFGIFVQIYVAAVDRDRPRVSSAVVSAEGSCTRGGKKDRGRGRRGRSPPPHLGVGDEDNDDDDHKFKRQAHPGSISAPAHSRTPPARNIVGWDNRADDLVACSGPETANDASHKGANTGAGAEAETTGGHIEKPQYSCQLRWLFPAGRGDGGRRAFERYTICGGGIHGLVTLEAAGAIVRDAGKYISADRVWRWFSDWSTRKNSLEATGAKPGGASGRGRFLQFEDFVEMCDGLREHMEDVCILSDDDTQKISSTYLTKGAMPFRSGCLFSELLAWGRLNISPENMKSHRFSCATRPTSLCAT